MIENKRFDYTRYDDNTESIYDDETGEYYFNMDLDEIEKVLNELNDENQQLENEVKTLVKLNNKLIELLSVIGLKTDEALQLIYNEGL